MLPRRPVQRLLWVLSFMRTYPPKVTLSSPMSPGPFVHLYQLMSTGSILSILAYPQYGYHIVYHSGLSLVHCSYLSVGSLHQQPMYGIDTF